MRLKIGIFNAKFLKSFAFKSFEDQEIATVESSVLFFYMYKNTLLQE
jgi:hypothetical protein